MHTSIVTASRTPLLSYLMRPAGEESAIFTSVNRLIVQLSGRILCPMNVTFSIDDKILDRARQLAQQRGTSLNQMIRDYLEELTASDPAQVVAELEHLWNEEEGDSGGWTWNREEVHDRSVLP